MSRVSASSLPSTPTTSTPLTTPDVSPFKPKPTPATTTVGGTDEFQTKMDTSAAPISALMPAYQLPAAELALDFISSALAARLAMFVLGQVLYFKDQIPYPMNQLAKVALRDAHKGVSNKTTKQRLKMLDAFAVLASQLHSTFDALTVAVANNQRTNGSSQQAHLVFALGSTLANGRARVIFALDGIGVSSTHDENTNRRPKQCDEQQRHRVPLARVDARNSAGMPSIPGRSLELDVDSDEPINLNDEDTSCWDVPPDSDSDEESDPELEDASDNEAPRSIQPTQHQAEQEAAFSTAERRLALVINNADLFYQALPATTTHVLLRAPRCFKHPEWAPQQRFQRTFDKVLDEAKEGVRVVCAAPARSASLSGSATPGMNQGRSATHAAHPIEVEDEEQHEMIWWLWNGRLTGFEELVASG
ncbi:hypothetical protein BKA62DRAFT_710065 [Auriculariales sp. MPI-PUGE-AT-0066]|nr:hypothetical protein BKA62DRAFT_710065 [Auriculariales sp. MPI-PUGE-AT-0066]